MDNQPSVTGTYMPARSVRSAITDRPSWSSAENRLLNRLAEQPLAAVDKTWTNLFMSRYLPCTGQGFLAASGAVSLCGSLIRC
jgi:hypothetical protein